MVNPFQGPNAKFYIAGGAVAFVLVAYEYRKSKTAAVAAPTDPGNADGSYVDSTDPYASDTSGLYGYVSPSGGIAPSVNTTTIVTNEQWDQAALQALVAQGYDPVAVSTALGHYLSGAPNTTAQDDIVQAAIGLEGYPPKGAPPRNVVPVTPGGTTNSAKPKDGYYVLFPQRFQYQVQDGKLYQVSVRTAADLKRQGVKLTPILINNAVMKLPHGTPFVV